MDKQREKFEHWQIDTGRTVPMWLILGKDGKYGLNDIQDEWEVWQAAQQDKREFAEKVAKVVAGIVAERYHKGYGTYDIDEIIRKLEEE